MIGVLIVVFQCYRLTFHPFIFPPDFLLSESQAKSMLQGNSASGNQAEDSRNKKFSLTPGNGERVLLRKDSSATRRNALIANEVSTRSVARKTSYLFTLSEQLCI